MILVLAKGAFIWSKYSKEKL